MADLNKGFKGIFMKSMEAISDTASKIATSTKYKVDEMNIINRRREILTDFGAKSYALWKTGEQFPEELNELLKELDQLENELAAIRAEKAPKVAPVQPDEADEKPSLEEKVDDVLDKVEDSLETVGEKIGKAVDALKEAAFGDPEEEEKTAPVLDVEQEQPVSAQNTAEVPTIKVEE